MFWDNFNMACVKIGKKPNPVAKEIGISSSTVTSWKNGGIPNGETLLKLADYLGVSIDYLLGRTNIPNSSDSNNISGDINSDNNVQSIEANNSISRRDMELLENINKLSFNEYVELVNYINSKIKVG